MVVQCWSNSFLLGQSYPRLLQAVFLQGDALAMPADLQHISEEKSLLASSVSNRVLFVLRPATHLMMAWKACLCLAFEVCFQGSH